VAIQGDPARERTSATTPAAPATASAAWAACTPSSTAEPPVKPTPRCSTALEPAITHPPVVITRSSGTSGVGGAASAATTPDQRRTACATNAAVRKTPCQANPP